MKYEIVHTTAYEYSKAVVVSHHVSRLSPRSAGRQQCLRHELAIDPGPALVRDHRDYFGNVTTFFIVEGSHVSLTVTARSEVAVEPTQPPATSLPWEAARDYDRLPPEVIEYTFDSPTIPTLPALLEYARPSFPARRPLIEAVTDLTGRINRDFEFDPGATTVATPLRDVIRLRRGVCQDFAHLEIGCLRALGLPARYVSGYIETVPPPGAHRLTGVDASHAWLSVYCPEAGWVDVDPTNDMLPSDTHVTLAWGRDFADVSPIRGVILGGGEHALRVSVDVVRVVA